MLNYQSNEYDDIIKKIKKRRKIVIAITVIVLLIVIMFSSALNIEVLDKTVVQYDGISPIIAIPLVLVILFIGLMAYVAVSNALTTSMDIECDPKKYLILNDELNNQKDKNDVYTGGFFYLGEFEKAYKFANEMLVKYKPSTMLIALFNKARCEFFLKDFDSLKQTVEQYKKALNSMQKIGERKKECYGKLQKILNLLVAISNNDSEEISKYRDIEVWRTSNAVQGFVYYLKGIAAYNLNDKKETIYRLMYVKENCQKTVFSELADKYLSELGD